MLAADECVLVAALPYIDALAMLVCHLACDYFCKATCAAAGSVIVSQAKAVTARCNKQCHTAMQAFTGDTTRVGATALVAVMAMSLKMRTASVATGRVRGRSRQPGRVCVSAAPRLGWCMECAQSKMHEQLHQQLHGILMTACKHLHWLHGMHRGNIRHTQQLQT